jgi:hypothetical protein
MSVMRVFHLSGVVMTIELSPQLQSALESEAASQGTTAQTLAIKIIESQLGAPAKPAEQVMTPACQEGELDEWWKQHLASLPPPSNEPRPEWLRADNSGEAFTKILEERRRQGRQ